MKVFDVTDKIVEYNISAITYTLEVNTVKLECKYLEKHLKHLKYTLRIHSKTQSEGNGPSAPCLTSVDTRSF